MPRKAPTPCRRCRTATTNSDGYCDDCASFGRNERKRRGRHKVTDPFYRSGRWQRYSKQYKRDNPLCCECGRPTEICDHKKPIKDGGEPWDQANHQPMCQRCHNKKTGTENRNRRGGAG
jgi:5-methylcytosine-specific restriction protein A